MHTRISLAMIAAALVASSAGAEEPNHTELYARIESMEAELAQQRAELDSFGAYGVGQTCDANSVYADYELTILQPYFSDAGSGPGFDESFGVGHRFTLGMENHRGYGGRVRYWTYDHSLVGHGVFAGDMLHIDMDSLDLDLTLHERFRRWDLLVSAGARYGRNSYGSDTIFGPGEARFEGFGPTCSLEADRKIGSRGLHLIGSFRGSMLFGDVDFFGLTVEDELMTVLDNQLGVGWTRPLGQATLDVRAVWESQFWLNNAFADTWGGLGSNVGFTGPTVAIELRR